ncbi:CNNM domain-containing protein [Nocardioides panacisoli]|uniref:CNNM domain-containing protein n=1 Tax=Nocardioides panacisoli TaxID=627624 RepID=UPI001C6315CF|nr:CNNM domain-containing protein [Nocardioides panacisoli]QYJ03266.1 CNNM domain-containing protein [Nocardioides panacisoli]
MEHPVTVAVATAAIIVLSALFVVVEFSLLGARRHRLEESAATSRSARAALRSMNELTVMLAGAQLGITACTLALGAITKPAVHHWLEPAIATIGMPGWVADGVAFGLALLVVTFLHLVVGEMAPKSWAIAHPELSASAIALPARAFIWAFRPLLGWINTLANRLVAASGVEPVDRAGVAGYDAATIRHLVEHSAEAGVLEPTFREQIARAIDLESLEVASLVPAGVRPTAVATSATVADVRAASVRSGHLRILLHDDGPGAPRVVHVRDTLLEPDDRAAADLARDPLRLARETPVHEALAQLRDGGEQLAAVMDGDRLVGVVTMADILRRVLPHGSGGAEVPA